MGNIKKSKAGFTLAELLVVTAVILILTALILPNYRAGGSQFALERSAHKLAQDLRTAEEMAMSAKKFQDQIPSGGYGIYFNKGEPLYYVLFADLNGNYQYDEGELVKNFLLEKEVQIKTLSTNIRFDISSLSIVFCPPDPTVEIYVETYPTDNSKEAIITLSLKSDSSQTKEVSVNKAGLTDID
jgi:prepilin-type N-terminal cleavage/methylation domain-containing protein